MSADTLELLAREGADGVTLCAPDVGLFTQALPAGAALAPGQAAGALLRLGRRTTLVVPAGVAGRVTACPPERRRAPVGVGDALYQLEPLDGEAFASLGSGQDAGADGALVLPCPQAGRFYLRPKPGAEPFVQVGGELSPGQPVGLIEVMKTFAHVTWPAEGPLPREARLVRVLVDDGADVSQGQALLEVEAR